MARVLILEASQELLLFQFVFEQWHPGVIGFFVCGEPLAGFEGALSLSLPILA